MSYFLSFIPRPMPQTSPLGARKPRPCTTTRANAARDVGAAASPKCTGARWPVFFPDYFRGQHSVLAARPHLPSACSTTLVLRGARAPLARGSSARGRRLETRLAQLASSSALRAFVVCVCRAECWMMSSQPLSCQGVAHLRRSRRPVFMGDTHP